MMKILLKYAQGTIVLVTCLFFTIKGKATPLSSDFASITSKYEAPDTLSLCLAGYDELSSAFSALSKAFPDGCPTIHSKVYCERIKLLGYQKRWNYEIKLREIGLNMLMLIDNESMAVVENEITPEKRINYTLRLIKLAEWLEKGNGYGNVIVGARVRAVALLHIGFLSIDTSCPIDSIQDLGRRAIAVDSLLIWDKIMLKILENEIGSPLIHDYFAIADSYEIYRKIIERERKIIMNNMNEFKQVSGKTMEQGHYMGMRNKLPFAEAIFIQDPFSNYPNKTTTGLWNCYRVIPNFPYYQISNYVKDTLIFREHIGGFPLKPLPPDAYINGNINKFYGSEINAAFYYAWKNFSMQEKFRTSNHHRDAKTGELFINKSEETLAEKYLKQSASNGASAIFKSIHENDAGRLLDRDAPARIREGRLLDRK